jgi:hypothetical protein
MAQVVEAKMAQTCGFKQRLEVVTHQIVRIERNIEGAAALVLGISQRTQEFCVGIVNSKSVVKRIEQSEPGDWLTGNGSRHVERHPDGRSGKVQSSAVIRSDSGYF